MTAPVIVSYGAGVDSTAVLVGLQARGIRPDAILFADTGGEKPETYAYLAEINAWLARVGFPQVTVVRRFGDDGTHGPHSRPNKTGPGYRTLQEKTAQHADLPSLAYRRKGCSIKFKGEVMDRYLVPAKGAVAYRDIQGEGLKNGTLPSPAYRRAHTCSIKFKLDPVERTATDIVRDAIAAGIKPVRIIGYDDSPADRKRVKKAAKHTSDTWDYWYPLQDWGWTRRECTQAIINAGLRVPLKSACWFCPASQWWEVLWLAAEHPELIGEALVMEDNARPNLKGSIKGLGACGTFAWRDRLEAEGIISPGGFEVILGHAELTRRWQALATDDNALDGRTIASLKEE